MTDIGDQEKEKERGFMHSEGVPWKKAFSVLDQSPFVDPIYISGFIYYCD